MTHRNINKFPASISEEEIKEEINPSKDTENERRAKIRKLFKTILTIASDRNAKKAKNLQELADTFDDTKS